MKWDQSVNREAFRPGLPRQSLSTVIPAERNESRDPKQWRWRYWVPDSRLRGFRDDGEERCGLRYDAGIALWLSGEAKEKGRASATPPGRRAIAWRPYAPRSSRPGLIWQTWCARHYVTD